MMFSAIGARYEAPIAGHLVLARRMVQSIRRAAGVFTKILHRALPPHSTRGCVARHFMEYGWRDELD